jgi:hypothetical protein
MGSLMPVVMVVARVDRERGRWPGPFPGPSKREGSFFLFLLDLTPKQETLIYN